MGWGDITIPDYTPEDRLKLRKALKWSRPRMARYLNCSENSVSCWEVPEDHINHRIPGGPVLKLYAILFNDYYSGKIHEV